MISQLIQLGLNVICLSVTLVRVSGIRREYTHFLYAVGQLLHLLYVSYQSQRLIDHRLEVSRRG